MILLEIDVRDEQGLIEVAVAYNDETERLERFVAEAHAAFKRLKQIEQPKENENGTQNA